MDRGTEQALNGMAQGILSNTFAMRALEEMLIEMELLKPGELQTRINEAQQNMIRTINVVDKEVKKEGKVIVMPGAGE